EPKPNVVLLGDAAHVMPPFAGEGVNMAMLDALDLSRNFISDKFDNIQEAIAGYEAGMRKRAAIAAQESLENGETMHSARALQAMVTMFEGHGIK
ncbi:2-polyprenyl-6-methoxyphenol hydroxylase, partial [Nostoc linckia z16]